MKIKIDDLRQLMQSILASKNYTSGEAEKIAEVLLFGELTGKNAHGILKLLGSEPAQDMKPQRKPRFIKETKLSAVLDGGGAAGPLPAQMATERVIEIAKKEGVGVVTVNNTLSSTGAISFYGNKIAKSDLIGIVAASSGKAVSHYGSIDPLYGTNPIAFSFPTYEYPIVFDMASSAITWYGLVRAKTLGEQLPENVAIDKEGNLTTDPEQAMKGAILPFDRSYKGSGIAMVVELLAGVLAGGSFIADEGNWGTVFIAIDPELTIGRSEFKKRSSEMVRKIKSARPKSGESIHIPGYDTEAKMKKTIESGEIEIEDKILAALEEKLESDKS